MYRGRLHGRRDPVKPPRFCSLISEMKLRDGGKLPTTLKTKMRSFFFQDYVFSRFGLHHFSGYLALMKGDYRKLIYSWIVL